MNIAGKRLTLASPTDEALDSFDCGDEEVTKHFRERRYFDAKRKPHSGGYKFVDMNGAAAGFMHLNPSKRLIRDDCEEYGRFMVVFAFGVSLPFQGQVDPGDPAGRRFAEVLMGEAVRLAQQKEGCIGLHLWVRANNRRAINFYQRLGFAGDPGGPAKRGEGEPYLTMRRML